MATDRETKVLLKALVDGQVKLTERVDKLAEGQERLTDRVDKLTEQMTRAATLINALGEGQAKLSERVDGFTAAVLRGFTEGAGRDLATDRRVDGLEARVAKLEQR